MKPCDDACLKCQKGLHSNPADNAASMTLTDFLLARVAEDEGAARNAMDQRGDPWAFFGLRVMAECKAKRAIVEDFEALHRDYRVTRDPATEARRYQAAVAMGHLATVYADHPDYREEWKP